MAWTAVTMQGARAQDGSAAGSLSGSIGGSIGGSIAINPAPARRVRPHPAQAEAPPRSEAAPRAARRAAGAGRSFDGAWQVSATGGCSGAGSSMYTVSAGRIIGQYGSGRVSPTGAVSSVGSVNGMSVVSEGMLEGSSGHGIYHQSDGCSGPWFATKL